MTQTEALLLTLAIEVPIAVSLVTWRRWAPRRLVVVALASIAASVITHPLLWLIDPMLRASLDTPVRWALLESLIVLVEASVYALAVGLNARRALVTSFVANATSFGVGLAIYSVG